MDARIFGKEKGKTNSDATVLIQTPIENGAIYIVKVHIRRTRVYFLHVSEADEQISINEISIFFEVYEKESSC